MSEASERLRAELLEELRRASARADALRQRPDVSGHRKDDLAAVAWHLDVYTDLLAQDAPEPAQSAR